MVIHRTFLCFSLGFTSLSQSNSSRGYIKSYSNPTLSFRIYWHQRLLELLHSFRCHKIFWGLRRLGNYFVQLFYILHTRKCFINKIHLRWEYSTIPVISVVCNFFMHATFTQRLLPPRPRSISQDDSPRLV